METLASRLRATLNSMHVIIPRIIAGVPLVAIGAGHFFGQPAFVAMLEAAGIPLAQLNAMVAPAVEVVAGLLLLGGAFARLGAAMAASTMVVALYAHLAIDPASGIMLPPMALPLVVLFSALYVVWKGAGAWSLDWRAQGLQEPAVSPSGLQLS